MFEEMKKSKFVFLKQIFQFHILFSFLDIRNFINTHKIKKLAQFSALTQIFQSNKKGNTHIHTHTHAARLLIHLHKIDGIILDIYRRFHAYHMRWILFVWIIISWVISHEKGKRSGGRKERGLYSTFNMSMLIFR